MHFTSWLILNESKQEIINLGFPEIVAKLFHEKFGNNAYLLAKWYRENKNYTKNIPDNWWAQAHYRSRGGMSLSDLTYLYDATKSPETYANALKKLDLSDDDIIDDYYLNDQRSYLKEQIKEELFSNYFFKTYSVVKDIADGKLKDIAPYKKLSLTEAEEKYDKKNIFKDKKPLKTYENGYKWINVGPRCNLVGSLMKNCGSAGVMSLDKDRTIITLFDPQNQPHAMVTYSPNEKRISGDQGAASTEVKEKYHSYVLDLANFLNARFDTEKTKSKTLKVKYLLRNKTNNILSIGKDTFSEYFKFTYQNKIYYTDGNLVVSQEDINKVQQATQQKQLKLRDKHKDIGYFWGIIDIIEDVFSPVNHDMLTKFGVNYILINNF